MADDTRLAEASLLLNYSAQSYKEQILLTKKLQQKGSHEQGAIIKIEHDQLVEKNVPSKLITPPPEHEYISEVHEDSVYGEERYASPTESEVNFTLQPCTESTPNDHVANQDDVTNNHYRNYYDISREPINNLLAAVNCALPGFKTRPTILQRSINHQSPAPRLLSNCAPKIQDHDYCQLNQGPSSYSALANTCTGNIGLDELTNMAKQGQILDSNEECSDGARMGPLSSKRKQKHINSPEALNASKKSLRLVAVHLGAGNSHKETESLHLAKTICEEVMLQTTRLHSISTSKKKRTKFSSHLTTSNDSNLAGHCECRHQSSEETQMDADQAVIKLIQLMEDHPSLNCGYGSNLNIKGQVECDASFMSEKMHMWTGVGAISGCRNPILLAKSLFDHRIIQRPLGLIQPNLLVGSGAKSWMHEHCPQLSIVDSKLISSKSFNTYQKLKSKYDAAVRSINRNNRPNSKTKSHNLAPVESRIDTSTRTEFSHQSPEQNSCDSIEPPTPPDSNSYILDHGFYCMTTGDNLRRVVSFARVAPNHEQQAKKARHPSKSNNDNDRSNPSSITTIQPDIEFQTVTSDEDYRLDTVGAIAVDSDGNFASAISSGGLLLKYKGRVGQAAVPGAGCWSEDSVAVTTTGVGEYLTLNMFARKFYDKMLTLRMLYDLGHVKKKPDLSDLISCGMEECFEDLMKSPALDHVLPYERLAGMLSVCTLNSKSFPKRVDTEDLYLSYAHNTNSMCVGYMTCDDIVGHSVVSRGISREKDGRPVVRTIRFSLDSKDCTETSIIMR